MNKIVLGLISTVSGSLISAIKTADFYEKKIDALHRTSDKNFSMFTTMNQWVRVKHQEKNISNFLRKKGYNRIAVYGLGMIGDTLVTELKGTDVKIIYGIDRNSESIYNEFDVRSPESHLDEVDAIIVTPVYYFDEIYENLKHKVSCPIISLDDILFEM